MLSYSTREAGKPACWALPACGPAFVPGIEPGVLDTSPPSPFYYSFGDRVSRRCSGPH